MVAKPASRTSGNRQSRGHVPAGRARAAGRVQEINRYFDQLVSGVRNGGSVQNFAGDLFGGRGSLISRGLDTQGRDLDKECGWPKNPTILDYREMYERIGPATRAVNIWPDECWASKPELYDTEDPSQSPFEKAVAEVFTRTQAWQFLHRADRLSGIGQFGLLLLGLDDGGDLAVPAATYNLDGTVRTNSKKSKLLYLRAFDQSLVRIKDVERNAASPRFGQPTSYLVDFADPWAANPSAITYVPPPQQMEVHWTRIIHLPGHNRMSSEVIGTPTLQNIYPYVLDLRKIGGSSAEMFWKGAFPGYSFETWPDLTGEAAVDEEVVREEIKAYTNGLQRYLTAVGGSWKSLAPQVADPSNHILQQLQLLCLTLGVPLRIFMGSEMGHLAATQDSASWKDRLKGRQVDYLEPSVVRPFVNRLMDLGCLPRVPEYFLSWRDLQTVSDRDRADVALKRVQALMQYVTGDVRTVLPKRMLYTLFLGLSGAETDSILKELEKDPPPEPPPPLAVAGTPIVGGAPAGKPQGGGRKGNPGAAAGRPAGGPPAKS